MNISESDYPVRWAICNKITRLKIKNDTQPKNIENQDLWKPFFNFAEVTTSNNHIFFRPLEEFENYLKTKVLQHWPIGHLWDQTTNVKRPFMTILKIGHNFVATSGKEMLKFQDGQVFYICHDWMNKLARLRGHTSREHFASNSFRPIHFVLLHFSLIVYTWSATMSSSI